MKFDVLFQQQLIVGKDAFVFVQTRSPRTHASLRTLAPARRAVRASALLTIPAYHSAQFRRCAGQRAWRWSPLNECSRGIEYTLRLQHLKKQQCAQNERKCNTMQHLKKAAARPKRGAPINSRCLLLPLPARLAFFRCRIVPNDSAFLGVRCVR